MKRKLLSISLITLGCLYGMLAAIVILVFWFLRLPITYGILSSIIILIIQFFIAPAANDWVFKHFYNVSFEYEIPLYLERFIYECCEKHKMKYPKIGFINDGSPNAFTYGRTKNDARIVITKGILELLDEEEVKAVVAHELGHANHYDMLFMTIAQLVPLILYYVYDLLLTRASVRIGDSDDDAGTKIGIVAYVLYILSQYIILWLSRTREYYADSFAIEETQNPKALANALVKIGFGLAIGKKEEKSKVANGNALGISSAKTSKGIAIGSYNNGGVSKKNIINAMKWEKWNLWAKWNEINSTHPLISKRLEAISDRCEEFGQAPYIEFNEVKNESYLGVFLLELLILSAPILITVALGVVICILGPEKLGITGLGVYGVLLILSLFIQLNRTHKNKGYKETTVSELLSDVKVSNVTSIPCILKGKIIGRGNPGCIFNEDFVIQDDTGIIFLDYNQPLYIINKLFALFKSEQYFDKEVEIKGWYRRNTVPYVEVYSMEIDGKIKKCHTYLVTKIIFSILMALSIWLIVLPFISV